MRLDSIPRLAAAAVAGGLILIAAQGTTRAGDEPGRLGRLFRIGGGPSSNASPAPATPPSTSAMTRTAPEFRGQPALSTPPTTAPSGPRLTPKSRVNKPVTEADPLVTRISLGRADTGSQFGMFLQVFADGTVIDAQAGRRRRRLGRPRPVQGPLRGPGRRLHRDRPRRRLRAVLRPAPGQRLLLLRQHPGLRPRRPPPPEGARRTPDQARPRQSLDGHPGARCLDRRRLPPLDARADDLAAPAADQHPLIRRIRVLLWPGRSAL